MDEPEFEPKPFQFSLGSLLVVVTAAAIACSAVATTRGVGVLVVGLTLCFFGSSPLSSRKDIYLHHRVALAITGFFLRLFGVLLIAFVIYMWLIRIPPDL